MIDALREGLWITRERVRMICLMLVAGYALVFAALFVTSDGRLDRMGRPLGTDFSQVWVAGKFVLEGQPATPFDPRPHAARQRQEFSATSGFFHWGYPPFFLPVAAFFALFPYMLALLLWQGLTLPLYLAVTRRIAGFAGALRTDALLAAAAFPAVFINFGHGHNGFLTAALMGGGVLTLERRPWLAGVLFGLVAYKPQFGLLLPLALVAGGHWRAFGGAALAVVFMTLATWLAFGTATWMAFFGSLEYSRSYVAEQGATGWHKIQSVFAMARLWGAGVGAAYVAQGVCLLLSAGALLTLWLCRVDWRLRGAGLLIASLLATPYALDYDMMILGPALALYAVYGVERGFRAWEKSFLALVWFAPLVVRTFAGLTHIHLGVICMIAFLALVVQRAWCDGQIVLPHWLRGKPGLHQQPAARRGNVAAFAVAGVAGFLADAGLTIAFVYIGLSPVLARVMAVAIAIALTWYLNRRFTFASRDMFWRSELLRYYGVSATSAALNIAVYLVVLAIAGVLHGAPAPVLLFAAAFAGSAVAACATYFLAARFAFLGGLQLK